MRPFSKTTVEYKAAQPTTPYQKAAQEWDLRLGTARAQARNWQLAFFGVTLLACGLLAALFFEISRARVVPYVVEVDRDGAVVNVGELQRSHAPTPAEIRFFLVHFVRLVEAISLDPVVLRENWLEAYRYLSKDAAETLNGYARSEDPFALVGKERRAVTINDIIRVSDSSYRVAWTVKVFDIKGDLLSEEVKSALFVTAHRAPQTREELFANPLGLYISNFSISGPTHE